MVLLISFGALGGVVTWDSGRKKKVVKKGTHPLFRQKGNVYAPFVQGNVCRSSNRLSPTEYAYLPHISSPRDV